MRFKRIRAASVVRKRRGLAGIIVCYFEEKILTHAEILMNVIIIVRGSCSGQMSAALDKFVAVAAVLHERVGPRIGGEDVFA